MECPNCKQEIDDESNFCMYCGFNVGDIKIPDDNKMYCHNCGRLIDGNSEFCINCGAKVDPISPPKSIDDYLTEAKNEFLNSNFKKSLELYEKALELDSDNEMALIGLIKNFSELENYSDILIYSVKFDKPSEEVLNYKLNAEINLEYWESAIKTIDDLILISDEKRGLFYKKIDILETMGKNYQIIDVYDQILQLQEDDEIHYKKSKLLYDLSKYEESLESIESAIKINPLEEYESLKKIIEKDLIKNISDKSYSNALNYFNAHNYSVVEGILSDYNDDESLKLRCECLYRLNRNEEALSVANQLLKRSKNADNLDLKAKIHMAIGNKEDSINAYKELMKLDKKYSSNLALAYGVFDEIELSKKYYSKVHSRLSDIWLSYYEGKDDFLISRLQNDFFNYPHLLCIKVDAYLKKSVSLYDEGNMKKALKFMGLSKKYLDKLFDLIKTYKLNEGFVTSNFVFLGNSLKYLYNLDFRRFNHEFSRNLEDIFKILLNYANVNYLVNYSKDSQKLFNFYKSVAKAHLSNNRSDLALRHFKISTDYCNSDGEVWLYIANLSDENKLIFYNKALFCFEKKLELKYDDKSKKLKGLSLFYLNRKREAFNIIKSILPKSYDENKVMDYIISLNESYAGR